MIWYLLKPVRENFEKILSTTKDNVKSSKERASIFGSELVAIGTFLDEKLTVTAADESLKNNFWYVFKTEIGRNKRTQRLTLTLQGFPGCALAGRRH